MRFLFLLIISFFISPFLIAQKQVNQWVFGVGGGLNFNENPPTVYDTTSSSITYGTASIANANGELLCYSDGYRVWDRRHKLLPNGEGLKGFQSNGSQCLVIVPKPGSDNINYIFTTGYILDGEGLYYSIFDLNLNGGFGDISLKNIWLKDSIQHRVAAVHHKNKKDIWVLVHHARKSQFYSFRVTEDGIMSPVTSNIGSKYDPFHYSSGQMKFSISGKKLAIMGNEFIEIFDFNTETGLLTNPIRLENIPNKTGNVFGVEFSPSERFLYVSSRIKSGYSCCDDNGDIFKNQVIVQLDLWEGSAIEIRKSMEVLINEVSFGFLQLAPDGKIYIGSRRNLFHIEESEYLSIIHYPNLKGEACNIDYYGIRLPNKILYEGLPNFVQSYLEPNDYDLELPPDTTICQGGKILIELEDHPEYQITWQDGSSETNYEITKAGFYKVQVENDSGCLFMDSITVDVIVEPKMQFNQDTVVLFDHETFVIKDSVASSYISWSDGSRSTEFLVSEPGTYWGQIENECFVVSDTLVVLKREITIPNVFTPNDDSYNDYFEVPGIQNNEHWVLKVYNRFGKIVFEDLNYYNNWKGEGLSPGVYFYELLNDEFEKKFNGWVQVVY